MAATGQYIVGTADQAGKVKHKDYREWVDSSTGTVVQAPGTSSANKANGTIVTASSALLEESTTRHIDAIDIEWAPYRINYQDTNAGYLRKTSDLTTYLSATYTYAGSLGNMIDSCLNNENSFTEANKTYTGTPGVIAANSTVVTYTYQTSDGKLWVNYKARPVLSINQNQGTGVLTGLSVSDHTISYTRTNLSVSSGSKNASTTITSDTTLNVLTGITQAANGQITYTYNTLNTTHSGNLSGAATAQSIGTTSATTASFVTEGSLNANGVLSGKTGTINHAKSGVGDNGVSNKGLSADTSPDFSGTFKIPYLSVNDCGHVTSLTDHTITLPAAQTVNNGSFTVTINGSGGSSSTRNSQLGTASTSANASSSTSITVDNVARNNVDNYFSTSQHTTGGWYVDSDINYKDIVNDINVSIDELAKLPIFDYIWKPSGNTDVYSGTSAQAVEKILPNVVGKDSEGIRNVDYGSLGTIIGITACKEIVKLRDQLNRIEKLLTK